MKTLIEEKSLTWKTVFNSDLNSKLWGTINNVNDVAKEAGYSYFTWNGWIYEVDHGNLQIKVETLNETPASILLNENDLNALYQIASDEDGNEESVLQTAYRMGRNSVIMEFLCKFKTPDYESN